MRKVLVNHRERKRTFRDPFLCPISRREGFQSLKLAPRSLFERSLAKVFALARPCGMAMIVAAKARLKGEVVGLNYIRVEQM
jgi:hypothetical protein